MLGQHYPPLTPPAVSLSPSPPRVLPQKLLTPKVVAQIQTSTSSPLPASVSWSSQTSMPSLSSSTLKASFSDTEEEFKKGRAQVFGNKKIVPPPIRYADIKLGKEIGKSG